MHFLPFWTITKPLTIRMDHAKILDILTSLPESHAIFTGGKPRNYHKIVFVVNEVNMGNRTEHIL